MNIENEEMTLEEATQHLSAINDSITLIASLKGTSDEEELATITRNTEHLELMRVRLGDVANDDAAASDVKDFILASEFWAS